MRRLGFRSIATAFVSVIVLTYSMNLAAQQALDTNLIVDGDFESGNTNAWTTENGSPVVAAYGAVDHPSIAHAAVVSGGTSLLAASSNADVVLRQTFDVSGNAADIDGDNLDAYVRALLGGFGGVSDSASVVVRFLDNLMGEISNATLGPISDVNRNEMTIVMAREMTARIPALTRTIQIDTVLDNQTFGNEAFADEVEFELRNPATPAAVTLGAELFSQGDFEGGILTPGDATGWIVTSGVLERVQYGQVDRPDMPTGLMVGGGNDLLAAVGSSDAALRRIVDVSGNSAAIDASTLAVALSGHFGGQDDANDDARIDVTFVDAIGATVGTGTVGSITNVNRNRATTLMRREALIPVPPMTRSMVLDVVVENVGAFNNEGLIDNASAMLVLDTAPAPVALNTELLDNRDFETGQIINPALATGWTVMSGHIEMLTYGDTDVPTMGVATEIGGGMTVCGVVGAADTVVAQTFDVSGNATDIDAGNLEIVLGGHFGGLLSASDDASLVARFSDAMGEIGSVEIGHVNQFNRNFETVLHRRENFFAVPAGTRTLAIELVLDNPSFDNEAFADNLSAELRMVTMPAAIALNTQLVNNGDFETGDLLDLTDASSWMPTAGQALAITQYGNPDAPTNAVSIAVGGGTHLLRATGSADAFLRQTIDLAGNEAMISSGTLGVDIQGFFGGTGSANDTVFLHARYMTDTMGEIGFDTIGGVTAADRGNVTDVIFREGEFAIPMGTRFLVLELELCNPSFDNLALADNIGAVLFDTLTRGAAMFPGSGEDFYLFTATKGVVSTGPTFDMKEASAGDTLVIRLDSINGDFDFAGLVVGVQPFTSTVPTGHPSFPEVHVEPGPTLAIIGAMTPTPFGPPTLHPEGDTFAYLVPPGLAGTNVLIQAGASSMIANNGFFAATDAHWIAFVP